MSDLSAAKAKQYFTAVRNTLVELKKMYPLLAQASELPIKVLPESSRYRMLGRLRDNGYLKREGTRYAGIVAAIDGALANDMLISDLIWPSKKLPDLAKVTLSVTEPEPVAHETGVALAPPPPIEGIAKPPPGASQEVVQEWIFTMLHAQTENLIYIREQVDKLLGQLL